VLTPFSVGRVSPLLLGHAEVEDATPTWFPTPQLPGPTSVPQPLTGGIPSIITAIMSANLCIG
jgi:hypothetical protein